MHARNVLSWPHGHKCFCLVIHSLLQWLGNVVHGRLSRPELAVFSAIGKQLDVRALLDRFALVLQHTLVNGESAQLMQ